MLYVTCFFIGIALLIIYRYFERNRLSSYRLPILPYSGYLAVLCVLLEPLYLHWDPLFTLLILLPLLYSTLDDMTTSTLNILLPMFSTIILLIYLPFSFAVFSSFLFFSLFLFFSHITKERWLGSGDAYFLLPALLLLPYQEHASALALSVFLYFVIAAPAVSFQRHASFPLTPFILLSVAVFVFGEHTTVIFWGAALLSVPVCLWIYFREKAKQQKKN